MSNNVCSVSGNIPTLPDVPAVKEKLAKISSQQKKPAKEESGILNIENESHKTFNRVGGISYLTK